MMTNSRNAGGIAIPALLTFALIAKHMPLWKNTWVGYFSYVAGMAGFAFWMFFVILFLIDKFYAEGERYFDLILVVTLWLGMLLALVVLGGRGTKPRFPR
jgi:hypothetical protein